MKRFLLLVVCVVAAFGAVPASAYECIDGADNGYLCGGDYGPFEACVWGWTGSTSEIWTDICADTNSDAWTDFYAESSSDVHSSASYLNSGNLQTYARITSVCAHAEYDLSSSYYNAGTC